jgi:catechol 2,3-dioxygenase-like lactoylglutathione lyase family enzyme
LQTKKEKKVMEVEDFGVVIRVHDLNQCRYFYQRLLGLEEPEINSTFLVRFRIAPRTMLILEKCDAPYLEHASAATALTFTVRDLAAAEALLQDKKYHCELVETLGGTGKLLRGQDPEGNIFYIGE